MGRARLVTDTALDFFTDLRTELDRGALAGEITPLCASRVLHKAQALHDAMTFANNRASLARLALEDVQDTHNIETRCAKARISPRLFGLQLADSQNVA